MLGWRKEDDEKLVRSKCFLFWLTKIVSLHFLEKIIKERGIVVVNDRTISSPFTVLDVLCCLPFFFWLSWTLSLSLSLSLSLLGFLPFFLFFLFFIFVVWLEVNFYLFLLLFSRHEFSFFNKFGWFFLGYLLFFILNGHHFLTRVYE